MKHVGKIFEKAVRNSNMSIYKIADMAGISQRHMYNLFEKEEISFPFILKISKIIGYDFTKEIPELTDFIINTGDEILLQSNNQYREKYFQLLEEHMALIKKMELLTQNTTAPNATTAPKLRQKNKPK